MNDIIYQWALVISLTVCMAGGPQTLTISHHTAHISLGPSQHGDINHAGSNAAPDKQACSLLTDPGMRNDASFTPV